MFWWVWRLLRDAHDRVDTKDVRPSFDQVRLDGFKLVDRIGFNRGGDPVFARYVLSHFYLTLNPLQTYCEAGIYHRGSGPVKDETV